MARINNRTRADMTKEQYDAFREKLHHLRKANGLTLSALGELVECTAGHISAIERGRKYPSDEMARDIAEVFGLSVSEMCGARDERKVDMEIALKFGKAYFDKRMAKGFKRSEVAGFAGITRECYADFENGKCSLGDSVLEKLDRLYAVEKEIETVEVIKEVEAECPISLDLVDTMLEHLVEISVSKEEKREMFRKLSEARTKMLERQIFG